MKQSTEDRRFYHRIQEQRDAKVHTIIHHTLSQIRETEEQRAKWEPLSPSFTHMAPASKHTKPHSSQRWEQTCRLNVPLIEGSNTSSFSFATATAICFARRAGGRGRSYARATENYAHALVPYN